MAAEGPASCGQGTVPPNIVPFPPFLLLEINFRLELVNGDVVDDMDWLDSRGKERQSGTQVTVMPEYSNLFSRVKASCNELFTNPVEDEHIPDHSGCLWLWDRICPMPSGQVVLPQNSKYRV